MLPTTRMLRQIITIQPYLHTTTSRPDPANINTQFILYTQEREINLDICLRNEQSIPSDFHTDKKLVVITHDT